MNTSKQLTVLRNRVLSATKNYEGAVNDYVKEQYFYDGKTENPDAFQNTVDALQRDGFKDEVVNCYIALGRRMKWRTVERAKLSRINVFSLLTKKAKESKEQKFGADVALQHLQICKKKLEENKKHNTKKCKEQIRAYALAIETIKKSFAL